MPGISTSLGVTRSDIAAVNKNSLGSFAGFFVHYRLFAEFSDSVAAERIRVTSVNPIWVNQQPMMIATEPVGTYRVWSVPLNHARTVIIKPGLSYILASDSNTVLVTAGIPAASTGANDDLAIDYPGNKAYTKTAGAWAVCIASIYNVAPPAILPATGPVLVATRGALPSIVVANGSTPGWNGVTPNQPGVSGVTAIPITTPGAGMIPGDYPLEFSGGVGAGTGNAFAEGTYTVATNGTCAGVKFLPGSGYTSAPACVARGAPGGVLPTFTNLTIGATAREFNVHHTHIVTEDCSGLIFRFGNVKANQASPINTEASEWPLTLRVGALVAGSNDPLQAFWASGSKDNTIAPGAFVQTVALPGRYLAGQVVYCMVRGSYEQVPTAWPASALVIETDGAEDVEFGTGLQDRTVASDPYFGPHVTPFAVGVAVAVLGTPLSRAFRPRVVIFGDSIGSTGNADNTFGPYIGFVQRALGELGIAFNNIGASGAGVISFMNLPKSARARKYSAIIDAGINYCLTNFVTNDLSGVASDNSQSILAALRLLSDEMLSFGIRLIPMTCCPRTNATNNGINPIDTANTFTYRTNFNAALRAANGVGYGYFDLALHTQEPSNNNLWRFDQYFGTIDGIHPNPANHTTLTAVLKTALSILLVDPNAVAETVTPPTISNVLYQRGAATTAANNGTLAIPAGSVAGDRFYVTAYGGAAPTALLSGFTSVVNGADGVGFAHRTMAKTLTSGDISAGQFTVPTGASWVGWIEYGSASSAEESPSAGANYSGSATTSPVPASTSTVDKSWHIAIFGDNQVGTNSVTTPPAGYTLIGLFANSLGATNTLAIYRKVITPAGTTGTPQLVWGTGGASGFSSGFISKA